MNYGKITTRQAKRKSPIERGFSKLESRILLLSFLCCLLSFFSYFFSFLFCCHIFFKKIIFKGCVTSRPYKFFKKICKNIFITLTRILSNIKSFIAILFSKKVWITFFFSKKYFVKKFCEKIFLF